MFLFFFLGRVGIGRATARVVLTYHCVVFVSLLSIVFGHHRRLYSLVAAASYGLMDYGTYEIQYAIMDSPHVRTVSVTRGMRRTKSSDTGFLQRSAEVFGWAARPPKSNAPRSQGMFQVPHPSETPSGCRTPAYFRCTGRLRGLSDCPNLAMCLDVEMVSGFFGIHFPSPFSTQTSWVSKA